MKIVILASDENLTYAIYNDIVKQYDVERVIIEESVSTKTFLKKRIKKIGIAKVLGQILFIVCIQKPLKILSKKRISEISRYYGLNYERIPDNLILNVKSINDDVVKAELEKINPDVVIVFGTRIIKEKIINACNAPFINMHMGITPLYRGVHGGYWALACNDVEHCGVTVHLVDTGIDTGSVIEQAIINVIEKDNFVTYPFIQLGEGVKLYKKALEMIDKGCLKTRIVDLPSKLWSHPTLGEYLANYYKSKIK